MTNKNNSDTLARLKEAKDILAGQGYTLVIMHGDTLRTSTERGIKPLLSLYEEHGTLRGSVAADKVVGKAAAFLYVRLGVHALYSDVISTQALALLNESGITVLYGEEVDAIRNRRGDGFCPMESAVRDISDPDAALSAIYEALKRLNAK